MAAVKVPPFLSALADNGVLDDSKRALFGAESSAFFFNGNCGVIRRPVDSIVYKSRILIDLSRINGEPVIDAGPDSGAFLGFSSETSLNFFSSEDI